MSEQIAVAVGRQLGAAEPVGVTRVAAGMSSIAWRVGVDGSNWIVRTPIADSGRRPSSRSEVVIGRLLPESLAVPRWVLVDVDGVECTASPELPGRPLGSGELDSGEMALGTAWTPAIVGAVAEILDATHALGAQATGWGPLENRSDRLIGTARSNVDGLAERWFLAPMWPFDGVELDVHPLTTCAPHLVDRVAALEGPLLAAASGDRSLVHSDLHADHFFVANGELTGLLDFGDAFIGSAAWDVAVLRHYFGAGPAHAVCDALSRDDGQRLFVASQVLLVAVCAYKLAKQPDRRGVVERLDRALGDLGA